eukprot:PhF_6_TR29403/c1_g1_i1/m.43413
MGPAVRCHLPCYHRLQQPRYRYHPNNNNKLRPHPPNLTMTTTRNQLLRSRQLNLRRRHPWNMSIPQAPHRHYDQSVTTTVPSYENWPKPCSTYLATFNSCWVSCGRTLMIPILY